MCLYTPLLAIISANVNAKFAGVSWGLGNREVEPQLPDWAVRLKKSHANLLENIAAFIGVVLIAHVVGVHDNYTVAAAWSFVAARLAHTLVYTLGITFLSIRTMLFFASIIALFVIA